MAAAETAGAPPDEVLETGHFGAIIVHKRLCPACGRDNDAQPASAYSHEKWAIKDCAGCGFVYIDRAPDYALQFATMAWEQTTKIEELRRAEIRPISYLLSKRTGFRKRLLPRNTMAGYITARIGGGNVVDLGCGDGHAMLGFPGGFIPFGIEISSALAAAAAAAFEPRGGAVVNAPCVAGLQQFPEGFFAAAALRSYLEHEANPLPVLRELHRVLQPGAVAVVKVPNYASVNRLVMGRRWCGFRYPDHLNYFTPRSLRAMAAAAGFATSFGLAGSLWTSDNMWAVLKR